MFDIPKHVLEIFATRFGKENRIVAAFLSLVLSVLPIFCSIQFH